MANFIPGRKPCFSFLRCSEKSRVGNILVSLIPLTHYYTFVVLCVKDTSLLAMLVALLAVCQWTTMPVVQLLSRFPRTTINWHLSNNFCRSFANASSAVRLVVNTLAEWIMINFFINQHNVFIKTNLSIEDRFHKSI